LKAKFRWKGTSPPTIVGVRKLVFLLPNSEVRMILFSFVWIGYQRVTDRRTGDGIAVAITAFCTVSSAAAL